METDLESAAAETANAFGTGNYRRARETLSSEASPLRAAARALAAMEEIRAAYGPEQALRFAAMVKRVGG